MRHRAEAATRHGERRLGRALCAVVTVAAMVSLTACTQQRSVEAYCGVVKTNKQRYLAAMNDAQSRDAFSGLVESAAAMGDLKSMWTDLANVAPDDIRTDTETVRDTWNQIADKTADRNLLGALALSIENVKPMERVDRYIATHCGVDAAPVGTGPSVSAAPSATPSADDPNVTTVSVPTASASLWDYGPGSIIVGQSTADAPDSPEFTTNAVVNGAIVPTTAYVHAQGTNATLSDDAFGAQQLASSPPSFVVASISDVPSSGLTPEKHVTYLDHYAAGSDSPDATATVADCAEPRCGIHTVTLFGDVAVISFNANDTDQLEGISLTTHQVVWKLTGVRPQAVSGSLLLVEGLHTDNSGTTPTFAVNATSGARAWTFHDAAGRGAAQVTQTLGTDYALIKSPTPNVGDASAYRFSIVNLQTGAVIVSRFAEDSLISAAYDPVTKRFALAGVADTVTDADSDSGRRLETLNSDGSRLFATSGAQYAALGGPDILAAYNGNLWIEGDSNLVDEVDSATGAQNPDSPKLNNTTSELPYLQLINGSVAVTRIGIADQAGTELLISSAGTPTPNQIAAIHD